MSYISIDDDLFIGYLTKTDKDSYLDFTLVLYSAMILVLMMTYL